MALTFRAARPMVWISEVSLRRNPALSASRMATSETSGKSSPSRRRLMPTSTSNSPLRRSLQNLDALEGLDFAVQISAANAGFLNVGAEILGQSLGERR